MYGARTGTVSFLLSAEFSRQAFQESAAHFCGVDCNDALDDCCIVHVNNGSRTGTGRN